MGYVYRFRRVEIIYYRTTATTTAAECWEYVSIDITHVEKYISVYSSLQNNSSSVR